MIRQSRRKTKTILSSDTRNNVERTLATIQELGLEKKLWKPREIIASIPVGAIGSEPVAIQLKKGGSIKIYPSILADSEIVPLLNDLLKCGLFRQYRIQGNDEPRAHFLLHEDATDDFSGAQPGYRYANISMKACPLDCIPSLKELAQHMAALCGVEKWTIGVNPILYRDGRDKMGDHSDNNQSEQVILCVLLDSPLETRRVVVRPFKDKFPQDEEIELFMAPGDAYMMDGEMQKWYSHSVPPGDQNLKEGSSTTRTAIVFRTGAMKSVLRDSGQKCKNLSPRKIPAYVFGSMNGLIEGSIYNRVVMYQLGYHLSPQGGISGNKLIGCDAIVVSGKWPGQDCFYELIYTASSQVGALALVESHRQKMPIRVFRSSAYLSPFRASKSIPGSNSCTYRYDGLYCILCYEEPLHQGVTFKFYLERVGKQDQHDRHMRRSARNGTLLSLGTIKFLLEWEELASTNRQFYEDRPALYSRFPEQKRKIPFQYHQSCEAIVAGFLTPGVDVAVILSSLWTHHNPEDYLSIREMVVQRQYQKQQQQQQQRSNNFHWNNNNESSPICDSTGDRGEDSRLHSEVRPQQKHPCSSRDADCRATTERVQVKQAEKNALVTKNVSLQEELAKSKSEVIALRADQERTRKDLAGLHSLLEEVDKSKEELRAEKKITRAMFAENESTKAAHACLESEKDSALSLVEGLREELTKSKSHIEKLGAVNRQGITEGLRATVVLLEEEVDKATEALRVEKMKTRAMIAENDCIKLAHASMEIEKYAALNEGEDLRVELTKSKSEIKTLVAKKQSKPTDTNDLVRSVLDVLGRDATNQKKEPCVCSCGLNCKDSRCVDDDSGATMPGRFTRCLKKLLDKGGVFEHLRSTVVGKVENNFAHRNFNRAHPVNFWESGIMKALKMESKKKKPDPNSFGSSTYPVCLGLLVVFLDGHMHELKQLASIPNLVFPRGNMDSEVLKERLTNFLLMPIYRLYNAIGASKKFNDSCYGCLHLYEKNMLLKSLLAVDLVKLLCKLNHLTSADAFYVEGEDASASPPNFRNLEELIGIGIVQEVLLKTNNKSLVFRFKGDEECSLYEFGLALFQTKESETLSSYLVKSLRETMKTIGTSDDTAIPAVTWASDESPENTRRKRARLSISPT
jgi:alkylated DNA repair dioxygenase AlkB